jgi:ABC-type transport system substrate-binding protein
MLALLLAACNSTVPPIVTSLPSPSKARTTPAPTSGAFVPASYPAGGDAPCGQAKPPDAGHAAYRGELKRIRATDAKTVVFELCRPDVTFLSKIASPAFGINDSGWLTHHIDPKATGEQAIVSEVNGTGPYRLEAWDRGTELSLARNDSFRGADATNERLIVRWRADSTGRVSELQAGTVDGIDDVDPAGVSTVDGDVSLGLAERPGLNVFFFGFTSTIAPFGNDRIRQALALGIDRQKVVDTFFPPGSEVAAFYGPCALPYACGGTPWYAYDPALARETLAAAGYPKGFDTTIHYSATPRSYLPDPAGVATELQAQLLANLGIRATLVVEPDDTYLANVDAGVVPGIYLDGQAVSYPDVSAFLDPTFGPGASEAFGKPYADVVAALAAGHATANGPKREAAYVKANNAIRGHVPMIPIARTGTTAAFLADVTDAAASPLRQERFAAMTPGDRRQLVWLTSAEPSGLYCADETDKVALLVCSQVVESLYAYQPAGAAAVPGLAEKCTPNGALTVWTCTLRSGVIFHDGSRLDAGDVLTSFAVQWNAEDPRHLGRTGTFPTFAAWFGGFLNAPAAPGG